MLVEGDVKENIDILYMGFTETETVKLFANTYLALRVSYFNELDTYAKVKGLRTDNIIKESALIRELETIIIPHLLVTGDTACQKIRSSCLLTIRTCSRI